jgi:hypothetical protein
LTLSAAILTALLALPIHRSDKDETNREARLQGIATAIASATDRATCYQQPEGCRALYHDRLQLAGLLLTIAIAESAVSRRVQFCQCERYECDPAVVAGERVFRARGLWQPHRFGIAAQHWDRLCESVDVQAWVAAVQLAGAIGACGGRVAAGISRYGSGSGCVAPLGKPRADRAAAMTARIRRMVTE